MSIKDREKHYQCFPEWSWEIPRIFASRGGACESKNSRKNARRRFAERKPELSCTPRAYFIKSKTFDTHHGVNLTGITLGLFSQPPPLWKISRKKPLSLFNVSADTSTVQRLTHQNLVSSSAIDLPSFIFGEIRTRYHREFLEG